MSSPCGKCNTCPCGTSGGAPPPQQPPSHRPPPAYAQQQQPESCPYPRAQGAQGAQGQGPAGCQVSSYQPQQQAGTCATYQARGNPTVECTCTQNRARAPPPSAQADHVTCSRPPREQPPPMETRCTCRDNLNQQVECHCAPPVAPPPQVQYGPPPSHANVTCGQSVRRGPQPYQRHSNQTSCGHCRGQTKKKKCVIQ